MSLSQARGIYLVNSHMRYGNRMRVQIPPCYRCWETGDASSLWVNVHWCDIKCGERKRILRASSREGVPVHSPCLDGVRTYIRLGSSPKFYLHRICCCCGLVLQGDISAHSTGLGAAFSGVSRQLCAASSASYIWTPLVKNSMHKV